MTLSQMKYFSTVCAIGNITKAADTLHISQPSITAAIKSLETELDSLLLCRGKKQVSPTPDGERFLLRCNHILLEVQDLSEEFEALNATHKSIAVGIPPMIGSFLFPLVFQQFQTNHPEISIHLTEAGSEAAKELVLNGELDLAIITMGDVPLARLNSQRLIRSELLYCVGLEHPLAARKVIDFAEIGDDPLILFSQGYYHRSLLEQRFSQENMVPNIVLHSNQLLTIYSFIRNNIASGFMMPEVARQFDSLCALKIRAPLTLNVAVIWRKNDYITREAEKFIDFCRKKYEAKDATV